MLEFPDPGPAPVTVEAGAGAKGFNLETWRYEGSAGDRVPADVVIPTDVGPWGVLLVAHGLSTDRTSEYIAGAARAWAAAGLAVVAADAPLHGERSVGRDPDFTEMGQPAVLIESVCDQRRLLSILAGHDRLGGLPVAFLGFSMGTVMGVPLVAADPRIRAAVFTIGGSTRVLVEEQLPHLLELLDPLLGVTDPVVYAPGLGDRPVLQMNVRDDMVFSERSARVLFDAFPGPKTHVFFDGLHSEWKDGDLQYTRIFDFVASRLRG